MKEPIRPMLATLVTAPPVGAGWIYEEKYDGIRALAYRKGDRVRLWSRNGNEIGGGFPEVVAAVAALPQGDVVLDGELVAFDKSGVSRFQLLQRRGLAEASRPLFAVFDCLQRDGASLLTRPLVDRRRELSAIVPRRRGQLLPARRVAGPGATAYEEARRLGWEGVIAKDPRSSYEPGVRSRAWLKVKVRRESEFVIGGYTPPAGGRQHIGALLVGLYDGNRLRFTGKVGTGFSARSLEDLADRLRPLRVEESPFDPAPGIRDAVWAKPRLVGQIAFAEWTADDKLRHPAFLGLRTDKSPRECTWSERER
jgi:bifunctional non-homologous end joining protein LigD